MSAANNHLQNATQRQLFNYFIVLDFEAVFDSPQPKIMEIIEFPSVLIDATTMTVVGEFRQYVKPLLLPQLNSICVAKTGITQDMVDGSDPFPIVYGKYWNWLQQFGIVSTPFPHSKVAEGLPSSVSSIQGEEVAPLVSGPTLRAIFVTCGDWDIKTMMPTAFQNYHMTMSPEEALLFSQWVNIKDLFNGVYGTALTGMKPVLDYLNLPLEGHHHAGLDDCRNISKILDLGLVRQGVCIGATAIRTQGLSAKKIQCWKRMNGKLREREYHEGRIC